MLELSDHADKIGSVILLVLLVLLIVALKIFGGKPSGGAKDDQDVE